MNDELQKQLAEMLAKLMNVAQDAGAFAANQIPPLVAEKIALGRVTETVWLVALTVWLGICLRYGVQLFKWATAIIKKDGEAMPVFIVPGFVVVIGVVPWFVQMQATATVWFAPRLYIVEWVRSMLTAK